MYEYYGNNDYRDYISHYGKPGMTWSKHKYLSKSKDGDSFIYNYGKNNLTEKLEDKVMNSLHAVADTVNSRDLNKDVRQAVRTVADIYNKAPNVKDSIQNLIKSGKEIADSIFENLKKYKGNWRG